jgi:hypothetical protein
MLKRLLLVLALSFVIAVPAWAATVRVKSDNTPLRSGPSPTATVLQLLKSGTLLEFIDAQKDWYKVRDPKTKTEGYVQISAAELLPGSVDAVQATGATPGSQAGKPGSQAGKPGTPPGKPGATGPTAKPKRTPKPGDWTDLGYLSVNGLFQGGTSAFAQGQSWSYFGETASANIQYPAKSGPGFDIAGGYRVWRNLAVGAGVSAISRSTTTAVTGSIPHPLYLNQPRTLTGSFPATRSELAIHLQAAWAVKVSPKMLLLVYGGPSVFSIKQTLVTSAVPFSDVYPYDTVTVTASSAVDSSKTAVGFGGGADFAYYFTKTIGVGGMMRYARASAAFPGFNQSTTIDAGGVQAGGGLRILFAPPKPKKPGVPPRPQPKPPMPPKK